MDGGGLLLCMSNATIDRIGSNAVHLKCCTLSAYELRVDGLSSGAKRGGEPGPPSSFTPAPYLSIS